MTYRELTHTLTDDTKYFSEANLVSGNYKIFVPKGTKSGELVYKHICTQKKQ